MSPAGYPVSTPKPVEATHNDRLNKVSESLQYQCERIESVLARVNGTPQTVGKDSSVAKISPTLPMTAVLEHLEAVQARLADLATGVERIA